MKTWKKVVRILILLIIVVPVAAMIAVQIPAVQTAIVGKVTRTLSEKIDGRVTIGRVWFSFPNNLILRDVDVIQGESDTVVHAGKLLLGAKTSSLLSDEAFVRRISLEKGHFTLRKLEDGSTNLAALIAPLKKSPVDTSAVSLPWSKYRLDRLSVKDFAFRTDTLAIEDIDLDVRKVRYDDSLSLRIEHLSLSESRGFDLEDLSADASWTPSGISLRNLHLKDTWSQIHAPTLALGFSDFSDFSDLFNRCSANVKLRESHIDSRSLAPLLPMGGRKFALDLEGTADGPLNDLLLKSLRVKTPGGATDLTVKGRLQGLPDPDRIRIRTARVEGHTRTDDLGELLEGVLPGKIRKKDIARYARGETIRLDLTADGTPAELKAEGGISSHGLGSAKVSAVIRDLTRTMKASGTLETDYLQLGKLLDNPSLGALTARTTVAFATTPSGLNADINRLDIDNFSFKGYDYHDISAGATLRDGVLLADVSSDDPNLQMLMHGRVDLGGKGKANKILIDLDLERADLSALNFDKRDSTTVSMALNADLTQEPGGVILGTALVRALQAEVDGNIYDIGDIEFESNRQDDRFNTTVESTFAQAWYDGNVFVADFISEARRIVMEENLRDLLGKGSDAKEEYAPSESFGSLRIRTRNLQPVFDFLASDVFVARESSIGVDLLGEQVEGSIASELVAAGNLFVHNLQGRIYSLGDRMMLDLDANRIQSGRLMADNVRLDAMTDTASVDIQARFHNENDNAGEALLHTRVSFPDSLKTDYRLRADILPSFLSLAGNTWELDPATVLYRPGHIRVNDLYLHNEEQALTAGGVIGASPADTAQVKLRDFDIGIINAFLPAGFDLHGRLTGDGEGFALLGDEMGLLLDIVGRDMAVAGDLLGDIKVLSKWDDPGKQLRVLVDNTLGSRHPLNAVASFRPSDKNLSFDMHLDSLSVVALGPMIDNLATGLTGSVSGRITGKGPLNKLSIDSEDARVNKMRFTLDYTKVQYEADGPLTLSDKGVTFNDIEIHDTEGGTGRLSGGVPYDHFRDIRLNIRIDLHNALALNTTMRDNGTFYGKAYADGTVRVSGPLDKIRLNINATSKEKTAVHIPLGSSSKSNTRLLTFINNEPTKLSLYDSLLQIKKPGAGGKKRSGTDLSVQLRLNATPDAEVQIEIDKSTGDILKARGTGMINIAVDDDFDIKGDYRLESGSYHFGMLGFTTRDFSIDPGGTIAFVGDVMQSNLDMTATYRTKASLTPLIADSTMVNLRRTVECGIEIKGKLANPQIGFKIEVPDLDPTIKNRLDHALNTEDKKMKQALALLVSGGFVPDEQSGIVNSTTLLYSNASEMMASQLNNIFHQLDIPIDLGFNYQPSQNGRDVFDVAVSTQLFNNRVSINGNIGNRQYLSSSASDIVGDLDIEIKLNRSGKVRLTLFSHSTDIYSNYLDMTQRNGAGIVYQEDFNSFKELWRKLLHLKPDESQTLPDSDPARRLQPR
ncbi:MAG: translocation/assembly module TamB domain-containing protein [Bacteroidales bacterium]|nr:translocation/assembly module TamB domain-containing protein [Bacteroidales bacterium]